MTLNNQTVQETDENLLTQFVNGEYAAFQLLYERHKGGLFRYVARQLHDQNLVEDIFQEVWSKVISRASSFDQQAKFTTWLYTIARHHLIDHIRHIKVVENVISESENKEAVEGVSASSPEQAHDTVLQSQALMQCLDKLPMQQKDCFLLKEESGLSAKEIAEIIDTGFEATKSRLRYAYQSLRHCLEQKLGDLLKSDTGNKGGQSI
ncbi:sigma-70 family RNA polymerase sigma factor [Glaciecola sp. 1036]|uniref:sigma-70 family RNA polymerase sigma factor n=1 Tax=Alteromonadaceae TaxID=72275 RepID=UPI003CFBDE6F